jgi:hypothetical protein
MDAPVKTPNLNVPMQREDREILSELRPLVEKREGKSLSLAEVARIALRELHKRFTDTSNA